MCSTHPLKGFHHPNMIYCLNLKPSLLKPTLLTVNSASDLIYTFSTESEEYINYEFDRQIKIKN